MSAACIVILGRWTETIPLIRYERLKISPFGYVYEPIVWTYSGDFLWRWSADGRDIEHAMSFEDGRKECDAKIRHCNPSWILCETEDEEERYKLLV